MMHRYANLPQFGLRTALLGITGVSVCFAIAGNERLRGLLFFVYLGLLALANLSAFSLSEKVIRTFARAGRSPQFSAIFGTFTAMIAALSWPVLLFFFYWKFARDIGYPEFFLLSFTYLVSMGLLVLGLIFRALIDLSRRSGRERRALIVGAATGTSVIMFSFGICWSASRVLGSGNQLNVSSEVTNFLVGALLFGALLGIRSVDRHFELAEAEY